MTCLCGGTLWRFGLRMVPSKDSGQASKLVLHRYKCKQCATQFEQEVSE